MNFLISTHENLSVIILKNLPVLVSHVPLFYRVWVTVHLNESICLEDNFPKNKNPNAFYPNYFRKCLNRKYLYLELLFPKWLFSSGCKWLSIVTEKEDSIMYSLENVKTVEVYVVLRSVLFCIILTRNGSNCN